MPEVNVRFVGAAAYRGLGILEFRNAWPEMSAVDSNLPLKYPTRISPAQSGAMITTKIW